MAVTSIRTASQIADRMAEGLPVDRSKGGDRARTAREIIQDLVSAGRLYGGQPSPVFYHRFTSMDQPGIEVMNLMQRYIAMDKDRAKCFLEFVRLNRNGE